MKNSSTTKLLWLLLSTQVALFSVPIRAMKTRAMKAKQETQLPAKQEDQKDHEELETDLTKTEKEILLALSAENGEHNLVEKFLRTGKDPNQTHEGISTPLLLAVNNGHYEVVKTLLKHKADQTITDEQGNTPLALALRNGHTDIVNMLRQHDATSNTSNPSPALKLICTIRWTSGDIALLLAFSAERGFINIVKKLLNRYGADPANTPQHCHHPLLLAANNGHTPVVAELLERKITVIAGLLEHKVDPNLVDSDGHTPLLIAVDHNQADMASLLLHHGADPDLSDDEGNTPITLANKHNKAAMISLLLQNGASQDRKNPDQRKEMRERKASLKRRLYTEWPSERASALFQYFIRSSHDDSSRQEAILETFDKCRMNGLSLEERLRYLFPDPNQTVILLADPNPTEALTYLSEWQQSDPDTIQGKDPLVAYLQQLEPKEREDKAPLVALLRRLDAISSQAAIYPM